MKYHIFTYGCQMNKSDSERLAAKLKKGKHRPAEKASAADLIVINACSVRQSAIDRVYAKVRQFQGKKIILTGCLLAKDKQQLKSLVAAIWPQPKLTVKAEHQSGPNVFVPIMTGCNNFCAYCVVPYTRGREYSRPAEEIIQEIKTLVKQNCQEITLLGQNVNSYRDKTVTFPKLLRLIAGLPGEFKVNFLTSHPKDFSDELIKTIAAAKKISRQIHLPLQSGDNTILKKMNRGYTAGQYKKLVKKIKAALPEAKISTDIIVGFPNETEKQFQNTVKLIKEIGFIQIYAASYSPRAGTAASHLTDTISCQEKKRRQRIVLDLISYR